tara:strand:- start:285 stop:476 length:192 start_codon:yes stop_codon:yes gene_type:complete
MTKDKIQVGDLVHFNHISGSLGIVSEERCYNFYSIYWLTLSQYMGSTSVISGTAISKVGNPDD